MRKTRTAAFTLLELLTVISIIAILAGLVLSVGGYATRRSAQARTAGEIEMLKSACESYKSDNGVYPRDLPTTGKSVTDQLSPKFNFVPDGLYQASSLFLYKELSGDKKGAAGPVPDGIPDDGEQRYLKEVEPRILNAKRDTNTRKIVEVRFLQDPFGFPYAYSTAAASDEEEFQKKLLTAKTPDERRGLKRPAANQLRGFNPGSFDLWSTGGSNPKSTPSSDQDKQLEWAKWRKNW